jgi:hypothetical protein
LEQWLKSCDVSIMEGTANQRYTNADDDGNANNLVFFFGWDTFLASFFLHICVLSFMLPICQRDYKTIHSQVRKMMRDIEVGASFSSLGYLVR